MCLILYAVFNESSFQTGLVKNGLLLLLGLGECNISEIILGFGFRLIFGFFQLLSAFSFTLFNDFTWLWPFVRPVTRL